jgi:hypothetical protein
MSEILHSPITLGVCLLTLIAWVGMLCAIFWPGQHRARTEDDPDARF